MMAEMMMGMMSGSGGNGPGEIQGMMGKMMQGGSGRRMQEMMANCIQTMLPAIDPDKRGKIAAAILSAIVEKGSVGMSEEQMLSFLKALDDVLNPST